MTVSLSLPVTNTRARTITVFEALPRSYRQKRGLNYDAETKIYKNEQNRRDSSKTSLPLNIS